MRAVGRGDAHRRPNTAGRAGERRRRRAARRARGRGAARDGARAPDLRAVRRRHGRGGVRAAREPLPGRAGRGLRGAGRRTATARRRRGAARRGGLHGPGRRDAARAGAGRVLDARGSDLSSQRGGRAGDLPAVERALFRWRRYHAGGPGRAVVCLGWGQVEGGRGARLQDLRAALSLCGVPCSTRAPRLSLPAQTSS